MPSFPSLVDTSLGLAIIGIILLIASQFLSSYYGGNHIFIEKGRFRTIALIIGLMFILTALVKIYSIMMPEFF